jgi:hypothetical protein
MDRKSVRDRKPANRIKTGRVCVGRVTRAGIELNVSPHWFRHAHASHALDRGARNDYQEKAIGDLAPASRYRTLSGRRWGSAHDRRQTLIRARREKCSHCDGTYIASWPRRRPYNDSATDYPLEEQAAPDCLKSEADRGPVLLAPLVHAARGQELAVDEQQGPAVLPEPERTPGAGWNRIGSRHQPAISAADGRRLF